ncbi:MAG: hypothetical protein AAF141_00075 [Pseudomonadota bacterium]
MSAYTILNALSHAPAGSLTGMTALATQMEAGNLQLTKKTNKPTKSAR